MANTFREGEIIAGKYRVEKILGRGGMGVVVAATHLGLGHKVAIKLLLPGATPEIIARFAREARASVRLKNEHVARVLDVGELPNGTPYMVMEHLEGRDLAAVLKTQAQLPIAEAVQHVLHACEAIAEAHAAGIIHRDLKPANLLLTHAADGSATIKVLDFGISKASDASSGIAEDGLSLTQTQAVLGSPSYMSPEQMKASRNVDARSDIWSLGIILYQLLAGRTPFAGQVFAVLVVMVNLDPPTPLSSLRGDIPPALEAAILRCLEKRPDDRFQNVAELAQAIAPFGPPGAQLSADRATRTLGLDRGGSPSPSGALLPSSPSPSELTLSADLVTLAKATPASGPSAAPSATPLGPKASPTTLSSARSAGEISAQPPSRLVPIGAAIALALGITAVALTLRSRHPTSDRAPLADSALAPPPSASLAPAASSSAAPTITPAPAAPTIEPASSTSASVSVSASASAAVGPMKPAPVAKPPPPVAPPPVKKNPLDIQIK